MPMRYDRLWAIMKQREVTQYRLLRDHVITATTLQKLRESRNITTDSLCQLCDYLDCQPGDIMEFVRDGYKR